MLGADGELRNGNFGKPLFAECEVPGFSTFEAPIAAKLIPDAATLPYDQANAIAPDHP